MSSRRADSPKLGLWLLRHFYKGSGQDALAGDLLERFGEGETRGWFLRQVLVAIGVGVAERLKRTLASAIPVKLVGATACAGAVLAIPAALLVPKQYVSIGAMAAISTSPAPLGTRQIQERIQLMRGDLLSRSTLEEIVRTPTLELYGPSSEGSLADATQRLRNDLDVWGLFYPDHKRMALWVKFTHADRLKAQAVVRALLTRLEHPGQPERLELMRPASLPEFPAPREHWPILLCGLGAGLGAGLIVVLFSRAPARF